ncbi:MAG: hypothetical protein HYW65_04330 [Candidatus Liptonbacteria bacterium]|nr:hypothetical protein [Candidatus Liptonbacteria bacterium]
MKQTCSRMWCAGTLSAAGCRSPACRQAGLVPSHSEKPCITTCARK